MWLRVQERRKYYKGIEEIWSVMHVYFLDSGDVLLCVCKDIGTYTHSHMSKLVKLYPLNMYSLLYIIYK